MKSYSLQFKGAMLERGFWLYVWRVRYRRQSFFYVGRTGDSASRYAASPFVRVSRHLDVGARATANTLLRHIHAASFPLLCCSFELVAVGPIYAEQRSWERHRRFRDVVAPMEAALAEYLSSLGLKVIGKHSSKHELDHRAFAPVLRRFSRQLAAMGIVNSHLQARHSKRRSAALRRRQKT
jgi:hypothetical protein